MPLDSTQPFWAFCARYAARISILHVCLAMLAFIVYKIVYQVFLWPYLLSPLRNLPGPPAGNLLIGQFGNILRTEAGILQREWVKEYGPVIRALGPVGIERLIFLNPDTISKILVAGWIDFPRPDFFRDIFGLVNGYGLFTFTGEKHKQLRKFMNPAFSIPNLSAQMDTCYKIIESLVDLLKINIEAEKEPSKGKEILAYSWVSKATLDMVCETTFDYKADSLHNPHNELAEAFENLLNLQEGKFIKTYPTLFFDYLFARIAGGNFAKLILVMCIPGVPALMNSRWCYDHRVGISRLIQQPQLITLLDSMHIINRISSELLAEKLAEAAKFGTSDYVAKGDIMSLLVRARMTEASDSYKMSDYLIEQQVLTMLSAGHDSIALGVSWTLYLLARNKDAQEKLRQEAIPMITSNPSPSFVELKELEWLDCVVMEGLRVLPPTPFTWRKSGKDQYLNGMFIPKDTLINIDIRNVNTWHEVWGEDAEEFKPERWLNLPTNYHPTFSYLTFITGPHTCIGKNMAITEMKALLLHLIANFEFDLAYEGQLPKTATGVTMKPTDDMPLRIRPVLQNDYL